MVTVPMRLMFSFSGKYIREVDPGIYIIGFVKKKLENKSGKTEDNSFIQKIEKMDENEWKMKRKDENENTSVLKQILLRLIKKYATTFIFLFYKKYFLPEKFLQKIKLDEKKGESGNGALFPLPSLLKGHL